MQSHSFAGVRRKTNPAMGLNGSVAAPTAPFLFSLVLKGIKSDNPLRGTPYRHLERQIRTIDGCRIFSLRTKGSFIGLDVSVRVRKDNRRSSWQFDFWKDKILRMPSNGGENPKSFQTRVVSNSDLRNVAKNNKSLLQYKCTRLF